LALEITVSNDMYPEDHTFEVMGLGEFTNGESRELTEDQEKSFVSLYQMSVADRVGENESVAVSGSSAIENMDDVLGVDISDTPAPPEEAILNNPSVSEDDPAKRLMMGLPATPSEEEMQEEPATPPEEPVTPQNNPPEMPPPEGGGT
jgi:hypothetical protein